MLKILCIDDDEVILALVKSCLEFLEHKVDICKDPIESIEMVHRNNYDLLILDVIMPKVNGFKLLKSISAVSPDMHFVLMSANMVEDDPMMVKYLDKNANVYPLKKPFDVNRLYSAVTSVLNIAVSD